MCTKKPLDCVNEIAHLEFENVTKYKNSIIDYNQTCEAVEVKRQCINGEFTEWSDKGFTHSSCQIKTPLPCEGGIGHSLFETKLKYKTGQVEYGEKCEPKEVKRQCINGVLGSWSDSAYKVDQCAPKAPKSCEENLLHGQVQTQTFYNLRKLNITKTVTQKCQVEHVLMGTYLSGVTTLINSKNAFQKNLSIVPKT